MVRSFRHARMALGKSTTSRHIVCSRWQTEYACSLWNGLQSAITIDRLRPEGRFERAAEHSTRQIRCAKPCISLKYRYLGMGTPLEFLFPHQCALNCVSGGRRQMPSEWTNSCICKAGAMTRKMGRKRGGSAPHPAASHRHPGGAVRH